MVQALTFLVTKDDDEWAKTPPLQQEALRRASRGLTEDPFRVGQRISRDRVPKQWRSYAHIYRLPLPEGWRAIYAVRTRKGEPREVRILFIGDHKRYDRLFGYS